jgi:peptide/nickel transport system substrate-binding protein/oligopeptide transport system substrate-binding protein
MVWMRGEAGEPTSLDPDKASTVIDENILSEIYDGLVVYDGQGQLVPGAAARWDIDPSQTVYTFHLRPEGRWSNGDPVTADDFVFALRRLMTPATGAVYANILYTLRNAQQVNTGKLPPDALGARAIDPLTLELTLERPVPYFLEQLAHMTALPLHAASVETYGEGFVRPGRLIGNGAFVLKDYVPNDRIVLAKNPYYYDAAHVALDEEIFLPLEDRAAALRRFLAGEILSYDDVPLDQIGFVRAHLGQEFKVAPYLGSYFYAFDTRQKPFDDFRVRQALSMVIDRDFLAERIWGGTMEASQSFVPPGIPSYGTPEQPAWADLSPFDREDEAKRLMQAAGYGPGHPLILEFRYNTSENHKATAIAIADMWKPLGVEMRLLNTDGTSHFAYLHGKNPFDVARDGWVADFPDAQNFLFLAQSDNKGLNDANYANPQYDALMHTAEVAPDPDKRRDLLHQGEALLLRDQPYLPLMSYRSRNLVSPRLKGWTPNVVDHHPGRDITVAP